MALAFPELGKHCSHKNCHTLDFLPFKCAGCSSFFCLEHRTCESHSCPSLSIQVPSSSVQCPICNQHLPLEKGQSLDELVGAHISRGCPPPTQKVSTQVPTGRCNTCRKKELLPYRCTRCHKEHCGKHRHVDLHACRPTGRAQ